MTTMNDVAGESVLKAQRMSCPYCGDHWTLRYGTRKGRQIYFCLACVLQFKEGGAVGGRSYPPDQIGAAIQMYYYNCWSLRKVAKALTDEFGIKDADVTPETIRNWVDRYSDAALEWAGDLEIPDGEKLWVFAIYTLDTQRRWQMVFDERTGYICGNDVGGIEEDDLGTGEVDRAIASSTIHYKEKASVIQLAPDLRSAFRSRGNDTWYSRSRWNGDGWVEHIERRRDLPRGLTLPQSFQEYQAACVRFERSRDIGRIRPRLAGWTTTHNFFTKQSELGGRTPGQAAGVEFRPNSWADLVKWEAWAFLPEVDPKADLATRHPSKEPASEGDCGSQG